MLIQKFSKDSKRGFVVGANNMTPDKLAAGAVTVSSALIISAIGGLFSIGRRKPSRAKGKKPEEKKKAPLWAFALPLIFNAVRSAVQKNGLEGIVARFSPQEPEEESEDIEIIDAIRINSEDEVYDHI